LFRSEEVARHLKISPEQSARLDRLAAQLQEQFREKFEGLGRANAQDRPGRIQELFRDFNSELTRRLGNILDDSQMKRFSELDLQSRGLTAFFDPEVQKRLGLNKDQISRLSAAVEQGQSRLAELLSQSQNDPQAAQRGFGDFLRGNAALLGKILTPGQMQTWRGLSGEPFAFVPNLTAPGGYVGNAQGYGQGETQPGTGQQGQGYQGKGQQGNEGHGGYGDKTSGEGPSGKVASPDAGRIESRTQSGPFLEPLFRMNHVVHKLELTPEQFDHLTTLTAQLQRRYLPEFEKLGLLEERERESRSRELLRTYSADWLKGAETILTRRQMSYYLDFVQPSGIP